MADVVDTQNFGPSAGGYSMGPGGSSQYIEQKLDDIRRANAYLRSPTARDVFTHAVSLLETAWLIETQGGVIASPEAQQARFSTRGANQNR